MFDLSTTSTAFQLINADDARIIKMYKKIFTKILFDKNKSLAKT